MDVINAIDKAILVPATQLGGDSPIRDQLVFVLAVILPFSFVLVAVWLYFSGNTKVQQENNREVVLIALAATVMAALVGVLLSHSFARLRPFVTYPDIHQAFSLNTLIPQATHYSFPSGHAFLLFTAAGVVYFIGTHRKLGLAMLAIATLVCVARVVAGVHYPSDVIGGAILGLLLAKLLSWQSRWVSEQMR